LLQFSNQVSDASGGSFHGYVGVIGGEGHSGEQSDKQQSAAQAAPNDQGGAPSSDHAGDKSKEQLKELSSNPTPALEEASMAKTAKGNGNPSFGESKEV